MGIWILDSFVSFFFLGCIFVFYNFIASYEERWLKQKFGQDYLDYTAKVPRWIPRLNLVRF
jgi:protein-S-isoprenylcysteine O-methyltransferase Ste14